jgi:hypothetical protein
MADMSDNENEIRLGGVTFWMGPVDHPMSHAHEAEAARCGADLEFRQRLR